MNNPGEGSDKAVHPALRLLQGPPLRLQAASIQRVIARTSVLMYTGRTGLIEDNFTHIHTHVCWLKRPPFPIFFSINGEASFGSLFPHSPRVYK